MANSLRIINKHSRHITQVKSQGASQAMLYGAGFSKEDMKKAQICIFSNWYDSNPCNSHLIKLQNKVKDNLYSLKGLRVNSIGISDGISMGTQGMKYSLPSRELIADSFESTMVGHSYDGAVTIPGCDKNIPGSIIGMIRVNRPSMMIYGGTIESGQYKGESVDVVSAFQSYGEYLKGNITDNEREELIASCCPTTGGACGGMYTANSMGIAAELLGLTLPNSSSNPANSEDKIQECLNSEYTLINMLKNDITPKSILTKRSFQNAIRTIISVGGSTNVILHLLAIAHTAKIDLTLRDFDRLSKNTPIIGDFKPSGKYLMEDLHKIGGTSSLVKYLIEEKIIDGDCLTITGKTLNENVSDYNRLSKEQTIIKQINKPLQKTGNFKILTGNLAPKGCVAKISNKEDNYFKGPAKVFSNEDDMILALENNKIKEGDVVVINFQGPKSGPGMPEMLKPTSALVGYGLEGKVALITDGRFSGGSCGFIVGHICQESQEGGLIAVLEDNDIITININEGKISADIDHEEILNRYSLIYKYFPERKKNVSGYLKKYIKHVSSSDKGCYTC